MPFCFVALSSHVGHRSCLVRTLGSFLLFQNFNGRGHATPFVELDLEHVAAPPLRYDPQIASDNFRLGRCMTPHMQTPCGRLLDSSTKLVELAVWPTCRRQPACQTTTIYSMWITAGTRICTQRWTSARPLPCLASGSLTSTSSCKYRKSDLVQAGHTD